MGPQVGHHEFCVLHEKFIAEAIRGANEAGEAIVIWGGGTRISIGDPPTRYDVALDLSELRGIVDHEPGDLTATVRAGSVIFSPFSREKVMDSTARYLSKWASTGVRFSINVIPSSSAFTTSS